MYENNNVVYYESYAAALLYIEFKSISNNSFDFVVPSGQTITVDMMRTMLKTAYRIKCLDYVEC